MLNFFKNNHGNTILLVLLILSGLLVVVLGMSNLVFSGLKTARVAGDSTKAYYSAEAGAERAIWEARFGEDGFLDSDQSNLYSASLDNGAQYSVDFSRNGAEVFYTSKGKYEKTQRIVEVGFLVSGSGEDTGGEECMPDCDGKECGDDGCGGTCGTCIGSETCFEGVCVDVVPPGYIGISSCEELQNIKNNLSGKYFLTGDIDCSDTVNWNGGFQPIGSASPYFRGVFDGGGHKILDLYINRPTFTRAGLFSRVSYAFAEIKNIGLVDVNIEASTGGGLVGYLEEGSITNSYVSGILIFSANGSGVLVGTNQGFIENSYSSGSIQGKERAGGLVGFNYLKGKISKSYSTAKIEGTRYVGGLVGYNNVSSPSNIYDSFIDSSFATGNVSGLNYVGGLVGYDELRANIFNSFATGNVSGNDYVGGLLGYERAADYTYIRNSYFGGQITQLVSGSSYVGGLAGIISHPSPPDLFRIAFWNKEISGLAICTGWHASPSLACAGTDGLNTIEMNKKITFDGWDFDTVWTIEEGVSYPCHKWYIDQDGSCPIP